MKTSKLTGMALDWAVAKCEGAEFRIGSRGELQVKFPKGMLMDVWSFLEYFNPSTNWVQGGPIIEHEKIATTYIDKDIWEAVIHDWHTLTSTRKYAEIGSTPLIAAMRCYVASKLGKEFEIPNELL